MTLKQAFELLKKEFVATPIPSLQDIRQEGLYLHFLGAHKESPFEARAKFALVLAAKTLDRETNSPMDRLIELEEQLFKLAIMHGEESWFQEIKAASFEGSNLYLYAVVCNIGIKTKLEI